MSAPSFASAIEAPTRLAPVRSAATREFERSAPSRCACAICEAKRFAPFKLARVRSASSNHAWSRMACSRFTPASLVLLRRAPRKIARERSSPERSRLDSLFPVKSAGAAPAAATAASRSPRVISAETMSGDVKSTPRIMSCAVAFRQSKPRPNAAFARIRLIGSSFPKRNYPRSRLIFNRKFPTERFHWRSRSYYNSKCSTTSGGM